MNGSIEQRPQAFPYICEIKGVSRTLLWIPAEDDGDVFALRDESSLYIADSIQEGRAAFHTSPFEIHWNECGIINFDKFWKSVSSLHPNAEITEELGECIIAGWNFIEYMTRTVYGPERVQQYRTPALNLVFDKIFLRLDTPIVASQEDQLHEPITSVDIKQFVSALKTGWIELASHPATRTLFSRSAEGNSGDIYRDVVETTRFLTRH